MSIYVLRYGDLLKIGYSSELSRRVYAIMHGIPGDVTFVGHMPGDVEVEAHLHFVFAASRFSGEWFRQTPDILEFCRVMLIPELPAVADRVDGTRKAEYAQALKDTRDRLREYAYERWPRLTHEQKRVALAQELGWLPSRLKSFYYAEHDTVVRATEAQQLEQLFTRAASKGGAE